MVFDSVYIRRAARYPQLQLLVFVPGIFFLLFAGYLGLKTQIQLNGAQQVAGVIVENTESIGTTVEFETLDGDRVQFTSFMGVDKDEYVPGKEVQVLYNPASPEIAFINEWYFIWGRMTILTWVGAVFLLATLYVRNLHKLRMKQEERAAGAIDTEPNS